MKLPLVGQNYALRSPAAAIQQTVNLIPQFIDDPNEQAKNKGILVGRPGYHLMGDLNVLGSVAGHKIKGLWSGGGRLFAVTDGPTSASGSWLWEIGLNTYVGGNPSTGNCDLLGSSPIQLADFDGTIPAADGNPAYIFGNGNQLGIVKNGYFWIDNGSGPILARLLISGTVNTVSNGDGTSTVTWESGDQFNTSWTPSYAYLTIDGVNYYIKAYASATSLTLYEDAGNQTGASYTCPAGDRVTAVTGCYLDTYFIVQRPSGPSTISGTASSAGGGSRTLTWDSGDTFDQVAPGDGIGYGGTNYIVDTVASPTSMTLTTAPPALSGAAWGTNAGPDLGRQFNISHPNDGESWDPLDFASKEGYPDYLQSIAADEEQLYLQGTESLEVWQDTGNALFPFQRIAGAMKKRGSIARSGSVTMAGHVYWLGVDHGGPIAYRLDGFNATRISTHSEEFAWSSGGDVPSSAVSYGAIFDGHECWVINFPGSLLTYVYDETASQQAGTPLWHVWANWTAGAYATYTPRFHTFIAEWGNGGMHVVGDYNSGKFFEQNLNYYDDNGSAQQWTRTLTHLFANGKLQFFGRMTLEMDTGSTTSALTQPAVNRLYSDDRGNTFGNSVGCLNGGSGVSGAFSQRVFWPNNGSSRDRVFQLTGNNNGNSRVALIDLELEMEVGDY